MATRNGKYWLSWLEEKGQLENLMRVIKYSIQERFGALPDIEDHVASAYLAIVDGAQRFSPTYTRKDGTEAVADGLHNFIRYIVGRAVGEGCASARRGGNWDKEAATFTDKLPGWLDDDSALELVERLGVSHLYTQTDHEEADAAMWTLNNGQVATTDELIRMLTGEHAAQASKIAECSAEELPMAVLTALSTVEEQGNMFPTWVEERKGPTPVVSHDLGDTVVVRSKGGRILATLKVSGAQLALQVNTASRAGALWTPEDIVRPSLDWEDRDEREMPWDRERRMTNESWPVTVTRSGLSKACALYKKGESDWDMELMAASIAQIAQMLNVGVDWGILGLPEIEENWENRHEYTPAQVRHVLYEIASSGDVLPYSTLAAAFGVTSDYSEPIEEEKVSRHPVSRWITAVMKGDRGGKLSSGVEALVLRGATVQAARA